MFAITLYIILLFNIVFIVTQAFIKMEQVCQCRFCTRPHSITLAKVFCKRDKISFRFLYVPEKELCKVSKVKRLLSQFCSIFSLWLIVTSDGPPLWSSFRKLVLKHDTPFSYKRLIHCIFPINLNTPDILHPELNNTPNFTLGWIFCSHLKHS